MSEWFTALELANARLPGLPHSKRKVNAVAAAKGWATATGADGTPLARKCSGRGGGVEYHISLLPPPARTRLEARAGKGRPETENDQDVGLLGPKDISRRDARLFVVARADDLLRSHPGYSRRQADEVYAAIYNSGAGDVPDWVRPLVKGVSRPTIERWRAMRGSGRFDLAAGRHSLREGCREIERLLDGEIATFIGALIVKQPFLTAPHIRGMVEGKYGPQTGPLPSERTFQRFISDWKARNAVSLRKLTDPDGYKSGSRLSGSNSNAHVTGLNQLWEIDASPADVLTTDGRHAIYVVIDIWSRRMMTLVTRTPRTEATLQLIRRAILAWGVPRAIKTDNGSDFTSQRFVAAMNSIGIPVIRFTITGRWNAPAAMAAPVPTLTGFQKPVIASNTNTPVFTVNAQSLVMRSFTLDAANQVEPRLLVGSESIEIVDRAPLLSMAVEAVPLATFNPFTLAQNQTAVAVSLNHGTVAGHRVDVSCPTCQLKRLSGYQENQMVLEWPLEARPLPNAGNDEIAITVR